MGKRKTMSSNIWNKYKKLLEQIAKKTKKKTANETIAKHLAGPIMGIISAY